jgi:hypothetical protein
MEQQGMNAAAGNFSYGANPGQSRYKWEERKEKKKQQSDPISPLQITTHDMLQQCHSKIERACSRITLNWVRKSNLTIK